MTADGSMDRAALSLHADLLDELRSIVGPDGLVADVEAVERVTRTCPMTLQRP